MLREGLFHWMALFSRLLVTFSLSLSSRFSLSPSPSDLIETLCALWFKVQITPSLCFSGVVRRGTGFGVFCTAVLWYEAKQFPLTLSHVDQMLGSNSLMCSVKTSSSWVLVQVLSSYLNQWVGVVLLKEHSTLFSTTQWQPQWLSGDSDNNGGESPPPLWTVLSISTIRCPETKYCLIIALIHRIELCRWLLIHYLPHRDLWWSCEWMNESSLRSKIYKVIFNQIV